MIQLISYLGVYLECTLVQWKLSIFEIAPKRCQGGRRLHCQRPQSVFEEDEEEETAEKKIQKLMGVGNGIGKAGARFFLIISTINIVCTMYTLNSQLNT